MAAKLRLALCCSTKRVRLAAPRASAPSSQYHAVKVRPELGGYGGEGGDKRPAEVPPHVASPSLASETRLIVRPVGLLARPHQTSALACVHLNLTCI